MARSVQSTQSMQNKTAKIILAIASVFALLSAAACSPAALEAKRLADQCNATYGFNTAKSLSCMDTGYERLAMANGSQRKGL